MVLIEKWVNGKINYQHKEKMYTEQEQCSTDPKVFFSFVMILLDISLKLIMVGNELISC